MRGAWFVLGFAAAAISLLAGVSIVRTPRHQRALDLSKSRRAGVARPVSARIIMGIEAALAAVPVALASLMIASYLEALSVPLGFQPSGLQRVTILWQDRQPTPEQRFLNGMQVLEALRGHRGVAVVASTDNSPFDGSGESHFSPSCAGASSNRSA